jgi:hypothetical protein
MKVLHDEEKLGRVGGRVGRVAKDVVHVEARWCAVESPVCAVGRCFLCVEGVPTTQAASRGSRSVPQKPLPFDEESLGLEPKRLRLNQEQLELDERSAEEGVSHKSTRQGEEFEQGDEEARR